MKNYVCIIFFISTACLLFTAKCSAQTDNSWRQFSIEKGFLPIRNYSPKEYNAKAQNWAIVQDKRGVMYFGNNRDLLEYDGVNWRLINTANETTVRSLSIDDKGKIYVGAKGEFGYLSPDPVGKLQYHSLLEFVNEKDREFDDVWKTFVTPQGVYFQTSNKVFRWKDNKFKVWNSQTSFHFMFYVNEVYVREREIGLKKIMDEDLVLIQGGELFANEVINFMVPFGHNQILLNTRSHGLYIMSPTSDDYFPANRKVPEQFTKIIPFYTQIDEFLMKNLIYDGIKLRDGNYAIGTSNGGTVIIDSTGNLLYFLNKDHGLQDEAIKFQYLDAQNRLWIALNNGISRVNINSPLTFFDDRAGLQGTIQSITRFDGKLYVATNLGVYYLKTQNITGGRISEVESGVFEKIKGISTECWGLLSFNDGEHTDIERSRNNVLLVTTNDGIFQINKNHIVEFIAKDNSWTFHQSKQDSSRVFIGLENGLSTIYRSRDKWITEGSIEGIEETVFNIAEDDDGNLWLGTFNQGVLLLQISSYHNNRIYETDIVRYNTSNGLPEGPVYVGQTIRRTLFATTKGLYNYTGDITGKLSFQAENSFGEEFANGTRGIHRFEEDDRGNAWMVTFSDKGVEVGFAVPDDTGAGAWVNKPFSGIVNEIIHAVYHDENGITWLGGTEGLFRYDDNVEKDYEQDFYTLVRKVTLGKDSVAFWGTNFDETGAISLAQMDALKPALPYDNNSVTFEFSTQSYEDEAANRFRYYLEGFDKEWSGWKDEAKAVYTNIPEGRYYFRVKAKNIYGHESSEAVYEFAILPPWYRTVWAYIAYVLSFAGFVYATVTLYTRGLQKIIRERTAEVVKQKEVIEAKNKDITDSINYAKKIQDAILPTNNYIKSLFPDSFILYKPKDIVSGDFYWLTEGTRNGSPAYIIAAADCTGHGVPGAFMSMIGNSLLNEIVNDKEITEPAKILQELKKGVIKALKQSGEKGESQDGMDIALCTFDFKGNKVEYAGANNPLFLMRNNELNVIKPDRMPIGIYIGEKPHFTNQEISIQKGDIIYVFSDGFIDQFGGAQGKKFMGKQFKQLFIDFCDMSMAEQKAHFNKTIEEWMSYTDPTTGEPYKQMDDILVIGVRV